MGNIFNTDFRDFIQSLNVASVSYILVGGYAVILHGRTRTTGDMDVWVKPEQGNYYRLMLAFANFGLPAAISLDSFLNTTKQDVFSFGRSPVAIDIMTAVKGLDFDEAFAASIVFEEEGLMIRTISMANLILAKTAAGRYKDLDDLEHLKTP